MPRVLLRRYVPASLIMGGFAIFVAIIGMLIFQQAGAAQQIGALIGDSRNLLSDVGELNILIRDAERGQRGYVLTGRLEYLAPYQSAVAHLPAVYDDFRQLVVDDPRQQQDVVMLGSLLRQTLAAFDETVQLRTSSGEEAARRVVLNDLGRSLMTRITDALDVVVAEENRHLAERNAAMARAETTVRRLTVAASALAVLFLAIAALMLRRSVMRRREIEWENDQQRRELERSNADLLGFAYAASHDLKSPLRAFAHLLEWISKDIAATASPETLDNLKLLLGRVARLDLLVDGLLAYARVGRSDAAPEAVDITTVVRNIVAMLAPPPGFTVGCEGRIGPFRTQRAPIRVVLENLIANGLKHHDRAEGRITVAMRMVDGVATFRVADDGPGIAQRFHDRIFVMFQTLASRDDVEASGIGLAMVKKKVEGNGGRIWVESAPPTRGTTMVFTWKEAA